MVASLRPVSASQTMTRRSVAARCQPLAVRAPGHPRDHVVSVLACERARHHESGPRASRSPSTAPEARRSSLADSRPGCGHDVWARGRPSVQGPGNDGPSECARALRPHESSRPREPAARWVPSGLHATDQTAPWSAGRAKTSRPPAISQTLAVPSRPADASCVPSGLQASERISPNCGVDPALIMSLDGQNLFAGGRVPDPDLAVVAARCQPLAVRAPGHRRRPHVVSWQHARLLIADRVPDLHAAIVAPRGQPAVRAPCQ